MNGGGCRGGKRYVLECMKVIPKHSCGCAHVTEESMVI